MIKKILHLILIFKINVYKIYDWPKDSIQGRELKYLIREQIYNFYTSALPINLFWNI